MSSSRLAQHLPSLFGPSRRAAWRLSLVRRALAAAAILLALHAAAGAARSDPPTPAASPPTTGPRVSLPLALPADHLAPGDLVGIYLPGQATPIATDAQVEGTAEAPSGQVVARVTLRDKDIGPILRNMGPERAAEAGFVLITSR